MLNNVNTLKSLKIKGKTVDLTGTTLTFDFASNVDLTRLAKSDVVAELTDSNATMEVTVTPAVKNATDGTADAKATVVVKVTPEDEVTAKTYTITVDKAAAAADASLLSALVNKAPMTFGAEAGTEVDPKAATTTVATEDALKTLEVEVNAKDNNAKVSEISIELDDETTPTEAVVTFNVTAEDGTTKLFYKITVTIA